MSKYANKFLLSNVDKKKNQNFYDQITIQSLKSEHNINPVS